MFIFVKILDAPTRFCYTESSYKEDLSKMMDINYELYKVFYYVAISLSFSDASKQLFISQSAVSQSVKVLEKKLGITLFIRSTKRVQLTPEGETLLRHIEPAMNLIKRGEAQIMEASNLGGGQLRIGASDTICRYYLVPFLNKFHKTYPNVHIKVTNQTSTKCVDLLEMGQVDLIVTNYPNSRLSHGDHIRTIHSFRDCFIASSTHYKELMDKKLHLKDLLDYPIMMLDRKSTTSEFLHHLFQQHQLDLVPEIELGSNDLLIDLARIGLGIAFVPDYCIPDDGHPGRTPRPNPRHRPQPTAAADQSSEGIPEHSLTQKGASVFQPMLPTFFFLHNKLYFYPSSSTIRTQPQTPVRPLHPPQSLPLPLVLNPLHSRGRQSLGGQHFVGG